MRVHTSRTEFGTSKHQLIVHVSYRPVTCVKGQQPLLQRSHGFGRCSCSAAAPSAPLHPTRKVNKHVPGQQAFTDVDIATRSMQQSRWDKMYGVVLTPPARDGSLPQVCNGSGIVMVEGLNDARAVRQGVNAPVLIIGGTNSAKNKGGFRRMQDIHEAVPKIVVLADPDAEGTRFRNWVVQKLGDEKLLHAFLPLSRAVLTSSTKYHSLGNPGIEHAHARDVAKAVSLATERVPGRIEFCREDLEDWEMVNSWDEAGVKHAALRREILCNALGVGKMDGGKLLKVLNVYNFNRDEVLRAVEFSHRRIPKVVPILEALKSMRKVDGQEDLIDEMTRPSVDAFVYAIQKKAARAVAQDGLDTAQAPDFICSYLEHLGCIVTAQFRDALRELFQ